MALDLGTLLIKVRVEGTPNIDKATKSVNSLERSLRKMLVVLAAFQILKRSTQAILTYGDAWINLGNKLKTVTTTTNQLIRAQRQVVDIANAARVPLEETALLYQRFAINSDALGLSQAKVGRLVEITSKAVALGGSTAEEASGAIRQFTQAISRGTLRGQELNSVMEQTPGLAKALAEGLGVTTGEMVKLSQAGKLSVEALIEALFKSGAKVDKTFAKLAPTVSQAFTIMRNQTIALAGDFNTLTGANEGLAKWLIRVANNGDDVINSFIFMKAAWTVLQRNFVIGMDIILRAFDKGFGGIADVSENTFEDASKNNRAFIKDMVIQWKAGVAASIAIFGSLFNSFTESLNNSITNMRLFGEAIVDSFTVGPAAAFKTLNERIVKDTPDAYFRAAKAGLAAYEKALKDGFDFGDLLPDFLSGGAGSDVLKGLLDEINSEADRLRIELDLSKTVNITEATIDDLFSAGNFETAAQKAAREAAEKFAKGFSEAVTDRFDMMGAGIGQGLAQNLFGGEFDFSQFAKDFAQQLLGDIFTAILTNPLQIIDMLFASGVKSKGSGVGLGSVLEAIIGPLGGSGGGGAAPLATAGGGVGPLVPKDPFGDFVQNRVGEFALGGNPITGRASIVGEDGPELFVPRTAGTIIPNNIAAGGGGSSTQNITINVHGVTDAKSFQSAKGQIASQAQQILNTR